MHKLSISQSGQYGCLSGQEQIVHMSIMLTMCLNYRATHLALLLTQQMPGGIAARYLFSLVMAAADSSCAHRNAASFHWQVG